MGLVVFDASVHIWAAEHTPDAVRQCVWQCTHEELKAACMPSCQSGVMTMM